MAVATLHSRLSALCISSSSSVGGRSSLKIDDYCGLRAVSLRPVAKIPSLSLKSNAYRSLKVQAARVGGVEVPNAKRIETSLQYIHGVGLTTAKQILLDCQLENKYTRDLGEEELTKLRDEVSKYMIEGDLRRFNNLNIKRLKDIMCYRGRRHIANLPCRGQKTKTNARTRRGRKIAIAGKKKVSK